jgi:DNA-nicking Smr family endonuclease
MSRKVRPEEAKLWRQVVATVRPAPGRALAELEAAVAGTAHDPRAGPMILPVEAMKRATRSKPKPAPEAIEPGRHRRIARGRDDLDARLDLHGLDQERARAILDGFLRRAQAEGARAALIITGKGVMGDGVLRRRAPEWLSDPALRGVIAGFSPAARQHGGDGAFYVAIKRLAGR